MKRSLKRWLHPFRLIFGLISLSCFVWLALGVLGFVDLKLMNAIGILFSGLLAFEAAI